MGCINRKLGPGMTELNFQIYPRKAWLKKSKFTENSSSGEKYRSCVIPSISIDPLQAVISAL